LKTNDVEADTKFLAFSAKVTRRILATVLAGAALLSLSPPGTTRATAECRAAWSEVATPLGSNSFYSVGAVGQNDVWAVGSRYDGVDDRPLAEHFDGQQWVIVSTPAPRTGGAYLRGVGGSSGTDVWAVGYQTTRSGDQATLIEHYDGAAWTIVPSPNPASSASYLSVVVAVAPNDVWAAGHYLGSSNYRTLVEHWDGNSWTIVPTPNVGDGPNALNGIAAVGPGNIWAAGYQSMASGSPTSTLILHFDGTTWNVVPSPNPGQPSSLAAVVVTSDELIWAAGFYYDGAQGKTLLLRGDESGFTALPSEDYSGEGNVLLGIVATGPGDIWAAGYHYPSGTSDYRGLIEHYDGKQWRRVSSAQGGSYTYLSGITAWTPGTAWAVGNTLTATIAESVCEIQVSETGFVPTTAPAIQGDTIAWTIVSGDSHRLKDSSGMRLFDSGALAAGSSFQFTFNSAGTYTVADRATRATSSVAVPVAVPSTGNVGEPLLVTWSAAAPGPGFLFDVQIRVPPDRSFHDWLVGQTATAVTYVPAAAGSYAFRARLRAPGTGAASKWSPPAAVTVLNP
jgi:plastocyanin